MLNCQMVIGLLSVLKVGRSLSMVIPFPTVPKPRFLGSSAALNSHLRLNYFDWPIVSIIDNDHREVVLHHVHQVFQVVRTEIQSKVELSEPKSSPQSIARTSCRQSEMTGHQRFFFPSSATKIEKFILQYFPDKFRNGAKRKIYFHICAVYT